MKRFMVAALIAALAACGGTRPPSGESPRNPDLISASELERHPMVSARQAIERLRPRFLRVRGQTSIQDPTGDRVAVYIDNTRMGGVEVLDQIQTNEIHEIRYMSAAEATSRYGTGHVGGAIIVLRKP